MIFAPFLFKSRALRALKGNWQTALLISFLASLPLTLVQLLQVRLPSVSPTMSMETLVAAVQAVPDSTWALLYAASIFALLVTPLLTLGCNRYFIARLQGTELGLKCLFSRARIYVKSLGLHFLIYVKVFLWSLLLIVPGIIAALRYSMAPYYMAQQPELTIREAMDKSKNAMLHTKLSYFTLQLSFIGWSLMVTLVQLLLVDLSVIVALVAAQFLSLFIATYMNGACAAFYLAVSEPGGLEKAQADAARWMSQRMPNAGGGAWNRPSEPDDTNDAAGTDDADDSSDSDDGTDDTP